MQMQNQEMGTFTGYKVPPYLTEIASDFISPNFKQ